jgi:hypothetical protein
VLTWRLRRARLRQLLDAEPGHKEAARELVRCRRAQQAQNAKDSALFSKMWAKPKAAAPKAEPTPAAEPMPTDA